MVRLTCLVVVGLTVGISIGYVLGGRNAQAPVPEGAAAVPAKSSSSAALTDSSTSLPKAGRTNDADVVGTLKEILNDKVRTRRLAALGRYCDGLDAAGVRAAMALLRDDTSSHAWELRKPVLGRWAQLDPKAAAEYAMSTVDSRLRTGSLISVLEVWTHNDPEAAKRFVLCMESTTAQEEIITTFAEYLVARSPEEAMRFAETAPTTLKDDVIWMVFHHLAHANPSAAIARATSIGDEELREQATRSALSVWTSKDPQAALAWMEKNNAGDSSSKGRLEDMLRRIAEEQPEVAVNYVLRQPAAADREQLLKTMASAWSYKDPQSALKWAQELPEGVEKSGVMERIVSSWCSEEPESAAEFIAQQPVGKSREEMLKNLGVTWTRTDPAGALNWALTHPSPETEKHVLSIALGRVAADDPARAVAALDHLQSADGRKEAMKAIASKWIRRDPKAAMEWMLTYPFSDAQSTAISEWTNENPAEVASWLNTMEGHPQRDSVVSTYASILQSYDPEAAATWAATVKDPGARKRYLPSIVKQMARYDADAARKWISTQGFAAAEQEELRKQVESVTREK